MNIEHLQTIKSKAQQQRLLIVSRSLLLILFSLFSPNLLAQIPERDHVIGVGEQLEIQVWNEDEYVPDLSGTVIVQENGTFTMPKPVSAKLEAIAAAGLRVSTLKKNLEGQDLLGSYLRKKARVVITSLKMPDEILILFSGVVSQSGNLPRGTTFGMAVGQLNQIIPNLLQLKPNINAITVKSAEGKDIPISQTLRLEWGDTIHIPPIVEPPPSFTPAPSPVGPELPEQEYKYLVAREPRVASVVIASDGKFFINCEELAKTELKEDVLVELKTRCSTPPPPGIKLLGIAVNIALPGVLEALLAFPDSTADIGVRIERLKEGDMVKKGEPPAEDVGLKEGSGGKNSETAPEDITLKEIRDDLNQVTLSNGAVLSLAPQFSGMTLSGILQNTAGQREAIIDYPKDSPKPRATQKPIQKQFKEGDQLEEDVILAKIAESWILLKKGEDMQLVLLRDPRKRVSPTPLPGSLLDQNAPLPQTESQPAGPLPTESLEKLPQNSLRALNTFSKVFFATPLFER
jgi:hypothetical protein